MADFVDYFRVDMPGWEDGGFSLPRIRMRDRRSGDSSRPIHWCFQRHLELILYGRFEGGSSGAIYKLLQNQNLLPKLRKSQRKNPSSGSSL